MHRTQVRLPCLIEDPDIEPLIIGRPEDIVPHCVRIVYPWMPGGVRLVILVVSDDQSPADRIRARCGLDLRTHWRPRQRGNAPLKTLSNGVSGLLLQLETCTGVMMGLSPKLSELCDLWKNLQCRTPIEMVVVDMITTLMLLLQ